MNIETTGHTVRDLPTPVRRSAGAVSALFSIFGFHNCCNCDGQAAGSEAGGTTFCAPSGARQGVLA